MRHASRLTGRRPTPSRPFTRFCVALVAILAAAPLVAVDFSAPIERLATGFQNSEGPVWVAARGELLFSDVNGNTIHRWRAGQLSTFRAPSNNANGLALDPTGRLLSCERGTRRVARTEADGTVTVLAERYEGRRLNAPNDLVVRRDGSVYFTDPTFGATPGSLELDFQGVYRISADGRTLTLVIRDLALPNGLAFSPDERQFYVNDNQTGIIRVYDVAADGALSNGRLFTDQAPGGDGMKVDVEGNVYCTTTTGVRVFDRAGRLLGTFVTPEPPANCAFGDSDGRTLYLTCRTGLYRVRLDTAGPTGLPPGGSGLAVAPTGGGRLFNLAVRSVAGAGGEPLIMGFAVGPGPAPSLLLRGVGPTLSGFGVGGVLADPVLTVFGPNTTVLAGNDDWGSLGNGTQISAAASQAGAFPLPASSRDAVVLSNLGGAAYTVQLAGKGGAAGAALIEAYDLSPAGGAAPLVNLSARARAGAGSEALIAGFVVGGTAPQRLLVRAVGPTRRLRCDRRPRGSDAHGFSGYGGTRRQRQLVDRARGRANDGRSGGDRSVSARVSEPRCGPARDARARRLFRRRLRRGREHGRGAGRTLRRPADTGGARRGHMGPSRRLARAQLRNVRRGTRRKNLRDRRLSVEPRERAHGASL